VLGPTKPARRLLAYVAHHHALLRRASFRVNVRGTGIRVNGGGLIILTSRLLVFSVGCLSNPVALTTGYSNVIVLKRDETAVPWDLFTTIH